MAKCFAKNGDPDQTPHFVGSDLGLHFLSVTLLRVSRLNGLRIGYVDFIFSVWGLSMIHRFPDSHSKSKLK